jgi:hypothetical protein
MFRGATMVYNTTGYDHFESYDKFDQQGSLTAGYLARVQV